MSASLETEALSQDLIYQLAGPAEWSRARRGPYFAARMSGLFISQDDGKTWQSAYRSLNLSLDLPTLAVAVAPGAGRGLVVFAGYNGGVLRSADGGETWKNAALREPAPAVVALAVSPNFRRDGRLLAGTLADGIFYSADGGGHWQTGNLGLLDANVLCLAISPGFETDQIVFAGTQSGLFCSRTAGRAWREVPLPVDFDAVISLALSPNFAQDSTLFAGTETNGLLCSEDGGSHWRRIGQADLSNSIGQIVVGPEFPRRPQLLVLHDGGLSMSEDGGAAWRRWPAPAWNDEAVSALLAPRSFGAGGPVLVGLESGRVIWFRG